jgi:hypothetical protein
MTEMNIDVSVQRDIVEMKKLKNAKDHENNQNLQETTLMTLSKTYSTF